MENNLKPVFVKCLSITGAFEGASFGGSIGNFDGAGISAFILQWNFLSTLRDLILSMFHADTDKFNELLGQAKASVLIPALVTGMREDIQVLVEQITVGKDFEVPVGNTRYFHGKHDILPDWKDAFKRIGEYFKDQQLEAAQKYFDDAIAECKAFSLNTERSVAFMFDQCVQRGKHSLSNEQQEFLKIQKLPSYVEDDDTWLKYILDHDSQDTPAAWRNDVFSRRHCILSDGGIVHHRDFDLGKEFGLTDAKVL